MLKHCIEMFKTVYGDEIDKSITDNYILAEGTYVAVDESGVVRYRYEATKKNSDRTDDRYLYFAQRDYFSRLVDMNKPIDSNKIIHSNNYLSFFVKKENINSKLTEEIIDRYYDVLLDPRKKYDGAKREMYEKLEDKYGKAPEEKLERNKQWIKEHLNEVFEEAGKGKNYLKIFFDENIERYREENEKYLVPNIYNSNQYNQLLNGRIFGLPNDNMSMNAKKPYLENKSRKNTIPYLIDEEEVLTQKKFFDFLMNLATQNKTNIYLCENIIEAIDNDANLEEDFSGYYMRIKKGKEVEIQDFDSVIGYKYKLKNLKIDMVIPIEYDKEHKRTLEYGTIEDINKLKMIINEVLFNKFLIGNFFNDAKDIGLNDIKTKELLLKSRTAFFNWFYKGSTRAIRQCFDEVSFGLIVNSISRSYLQKAKEQFNLRCGVLKYFEGGKDMAQESDEVVGILREKINGDVTGKIESDEEYYFAVGQLVSYFISLNRSSKKTHALINPILRCKTDERLKASISRLFEKYSHAMSRNKRVDWMQAMIYMYHPKESVKKDILLAGYLYSSLIYEKGEGK